MRIADQVVSHLLSKGPARTFFARHVVPRVMLGISRKPQPELHTLAINERVQSTRNRLQAMARSGRPILVGPWTGSVTWELLGWIPFLKWAQNNFTIPASRFVVLSRGGAVSWYRDIAGQYIDILDLVSWGQFRQGLPSDESERYGRSATHPLEASLLAQVSERLRLGDVEHLSPALMFNLFSYFLKGEAPLSLVESHSFFQPLMAPEPSGIVESLPKSYVTAGMRFGPAFQDTSENRAFAKRILSAMAEKTDVVLLDTALPEGAWLDEPLPARVHSLRTLVTPATHLGVITEVLSRADAHIGSYDGFCHPSAFLGIDTLTYYSEENRMNYNQLDLARHVYKNLGLALFTALSVRDMDRLRWVLPSGSFPKPLAKATVELAKAPTKEIVPPPPSPKLSTAFRSATPPPIPTAPPGAGPLVRAWYWATRPLRGHGLMRWPRRTAAVSLDLLLRQPRVRDIVRRHMPVDVLPSVPGPENQVVQAEKMASANRKVSSIRSTLTQIAKSQGPIVVGPWLSEVGFELLYWVPFLQWFKTRYKVPEERFVIVSRGGAAPFYRNIGTRYFDILDHWTPEQFKARNEQRVIQQGGGLKQVVLSDFDYEILDLVKKSFGLDAFGLIHPMHMYQLFGTFWKRKLPLSVVEDHTIFEPLPLPEMSATVAAALPKEYVAVRFYFSTPFPECPENKEFVSRMIQDLARQTDVVLLNTGIRLDDHWDSQGQSGNRVHRIDHLMVPSNNLTVQSQVVSRARAFVGTYGGLSYLSPHYGVDSLAFYTHPQNYNIHHVELSQKVFDDAKFGCWDYLHAQDLRLLDLAGSNGIFTNSVTKKVSNRRAG